MQTTVNRGNSVLFPTLVMVATYLITVWVLVTVGRVWSPVNAGLQLTVAPEGTLAEISKITSLFGALQSVNIKYPVALEPHNVPS